MGPGRGSDRRRGQAAWWGRERDLELGGDSRATCDYIPELRTLKRRISCHVNYASIFKNERKDLSRLNTKKTTQLKTGKDLSGLFFFFNQRRSTDGK